MSDRETQLDRMHDRYHGHGDFAQSYFRYLGEILSGVRSENLADMIDVFADARVRGMAVYFFGNGGKAALADEWANDLSVAITPGLRAYSLAANAAALTGVGNDHGYEAVFERQLRVLARPGDIAVGLSGSGQSENVINAIRAAEAMGLRTIAMTGSDGGDLRGMASINVHVPTEPDDGPIEDAFMAILHMTVSRLKRLPK